MHLQSNWWYADEFVIQTPRKSVASEGILKFCLWQPTQACKSLHELPQSCYVQKCVIHAFGVIFSCLNFDPEIVLSVEMYFTLKHRHLVHRGNSFIPMERIIYKGMSIYYSSMEMRGIDCWRPPTISLAWEAALNWVGPLDGSLSQHTRQISIYHFRHLFSNISTAQSSSRSKIATTALSRLASRTSGCRALGLHHWLQS